MTRLTPSGHSSSLWNIVARLATAGDAQVTSGVYDSLLDAMIPWSEATSVIPWSTAFVHGRIVDYPPFTSRSNEEGSMTFSNSSAAFVMVAAAVWASQPASAQHADQ